MSFWNRKAATVGRISSEHLANFGRWEFLKEQSGVDPSGVYGLVSPLNELIYTQSPADRATLIAELHRHAESGEWEKVGAWKYVREFLDDAADTRDLIDGGLLAIQRMRVTNLSIHMAPIDTPRYTQLTGTPPPNDGFLGPPVFDSNFGPTRQYYFDDAIATAARRNIARLSSTPGVEPGPIADAARCMWDFGMLIHRGPLVVSPDLAFEPNVLRPALAAASGVDHGLLAERLVTAAHESTSNEYAAWPLIGTARFIYDYLDPATTETPEYAVLVDTGLEKLIDLGWLGVMVPPEVLTPIQRERLVTLRLSGQ